MLWIGIQFTSIKSSRKNISTSISTGLTYTETLWRSFINSITNKQHRAEETDDGLFCRGNAHRLFKEFGILYFTSSYSTLSTTIYYVWEYLLPYEERRSSSQVLVIKGEPRNRNEWNKSIWCPWELSVKNLLWAITIIFLLKGKCLDSMRQPKTIKH